MIEPALRGKAFNGFILIGLTERFEHVGEDSLEFGLLIRGEFGDRAAGEDPVFAFESDEFLRRHALGDEGEALMFGIEDTV